MDIEYLRDIDDDEVKNLSSLPGSLPASYATVPLSRDTLAMFKTFTFYFHFRY